METVGLDPVFRGPSLVSRSAATLRLPARSRRAPLKARGLDRRLSQYVKRQAIGTRIGMEKRPLTGLGTGKPGWHSGAVFEAPALVAGFDDFAVMGQAVEERGRHLGVAKHTELLESTVLGVFFR